MVYVGLKEEEDCGCIAAKRAEMPRPSLAGSSQEDLRYRGGAGRKAALHSPFLLLAISLGTQLYWWVYYPIILTDCVPCEYEPCFKIKESEFFHCRTIRSMYIGAFFFCDPGV